MTTKTKTETEAGAEAGVPEPRDARVHEAVAKSSGVTIAQIAASTGQGRSTVTKAVRRLETVGLVERVKGGHDGVKRLPDTFTIVGATTGPGKTAKQTEKPKPSKVGLVENVRTLDAPDLGVGRLGKGELADLVRRLLADHPKVDFGPSQIAKELDRSAGAIANALDKMTRDGAVELVQDKPKRYKLKASA